MGQDVTISPYSPGGSRDRIIREALGTDYASLTTSQQSDATDIINERFDLVFELGKRIADISESSNLPSEFQHLFIEESVYRIIVQFRGESEAATRRSVADAAWNSTISSYSGSYDVDTILAIDNTTFKSIDKYVTSISARLPDRILIPSREIDQTVWQCFSQIWNMRSWNFRKRLTTFQINSDGSLTNNENYVFDQFAGRFLTYRDSTSYLLRWVNRETMLLLQSENWDSETGSQGTDRPLWFTIQDEGGSAGKKIILIPMPDKDYTVFGNILLATPTLPVSASPRTDSSSFDFLPREFHPALWNLSLGKLLTKYDKRVGARYLLMANDTLNSFGTDYDDSGFPTSEIKPVDVYQDNQYMESHYLGNTNIIGEL